MLYDTARESALESHSTKSLATPPATSITISRSQPIREQATFHTFLTMSRFAPKIYFCGSIRGGRDDIFLYQELVKHLQTFGPVLTEHVGEVALGAYGETGLSDKEIFERDVNWLQEADVVVAEVTTPSLGVGYELGLAEVQGKSILCLFRESSGKRLSAMISGNTALEVKNYDNAETAKKLINVYLESVRDKQSPDK